MFPFLAIAAQTILPEVIKAITDQNRVQNADQMKNLVDQAVQSTTKASTPEEAKQILQSDPAVASALSTRIAEIALDARKVDSADAQAADAAANADSAGARETLLKLLNEPESGWISITPAIVSYMVVGGFFILIALLIFGRVTFPTDQTLLQIINICIGTVAAGFATVLNFWLGSSLGSRRKDSSVALSATVDKVRSLTEPSASPPPPDKTPDPAPRQPSNGSSGGSSTLPPSLAGVGRSTDPSTINLRRDIPSTDHIPASLRYNNPGAQWPSREAAQFGQQGYGVIGGQNKIALFPSPVNGAAANFELLSRSYTGLSIGEAGRKWTGNNAFGVPHYDSNLTLSKEMLDEPDQAISLLKAIAERESGKGTNLTDEQWGHAFAMFKAGSADAFLGRFGRSPSTALRPVRPDGPPAQPLELLIKNAFKNNNISISTGVGEVNIVYIEGMNEDGSPNNDEANHFNDLRCVLDLSGEVPKMLGKWQATTEPGFYYDRDHPINPKGAARIKFGRYEAWKVGLHRGTQEALIQVREVTVCRDLNRDMQRKGDTEDTGLFGINQHGGYNQPEDDIGKASAGCLVGRLMDGQKAFMEIVKSDIRYVKDPGFVFATAVFPASAVLDATVQA